VGVITAGAIREVMLMRKLLLAAALACLPAVGAAADLYPSLPITVIVPYPAGGRLHLFLCGRPQRDSGLGREEQECQRLLEIEVNDAVGVAQIAD